jgi:uncharacterized protein YndB with AHSA1/START domain
VTATPGFTLVRDFDATPEEIWSAWTDPDEAAQWWHPRGVSTPRESVTIDARVGGRYAYTMVDDASGQSYPTGGVYLEVQPFERLSFTWGEPDADPAEAPVVTIALAPNGDRTRMTFRLDGVDGRPGDGFFYDGWDSALDVLVEHVPGRSSR